MSWKVKEFNKCWSNLYAWAECKTGILMKRSAFLSHNKQMKRHPNTKSDKNWGDCHRRRNANDRYSCATFTNFSFRIVNSKLSMSTSDDKNLNWFLSIPASTDVVVFSLCITTAETFLFFVVCVCARNDPFEWNFIQDWITPIVCGHEYV